MIDYHIHPDYSIDAEPFSMTDYCEKALELGLREICFTTHMEFDPSRKHLDWFVRCQGRVVPMHPPVWLEAYFHEAEKCALTYAGTGLVVRTGLEAGYDLGLETSISRVLEQYPFDFVIGSVHCLDHVAISSGSEGPGYFGTRDVRQMAEAYFRTLMEAVSTGLFDVIGHLDIYRRHGTRFLGEEIDDAHQFYIQEVFQQMLKAGTGIEINTSSLRHGQGDFYPGIDILNKALESGIRRFTAGSDCHRIGELGLGIDRVWEEAKKLGINFSVYNKRQPVIC